MATTKKIIIPQQNPDTLPDDDFFSACQDGETSGNAWVPDEEDVEGIGAENLEPVSDYTPRLSVPSKTDKNWIVKDGGGYNYCIKGKPAYATNSALSNCVGYAWGRVRELMGRYHKLSRGNAEDWYGYNDGYERGKTPKLGAVICWRKGNVGNSADGCGHVAIVEKIDSDGTITTSNSGWNSTTFYLKTIKKPYEIGGTYHFQGFIYPPCAVDVKEPEPEPTPAPTTDIKKGDKVTVKKGAKTYTGGSLASWVYNSTFDVIEVNGTRVVIGKGTAVTAAMKASDLVKASATPAPVYKFKVGDKVSITGNLYSAPDSNTVVGKADKAITTIGKIQAGAHPYNTAESLGWVDEASVSTYVEPKPEPVKPSLPQLKVGDKVKVLKAVTYTGKKFVRWYSKYDVIEVKGDRIVIGIGKTVTAAVKRENLEKI